MKNKLFRVFASLLAVIALSFATVSTATAQTENNSISSAGQAVNIADQLAVHNGNQPVLASSNADVQQLAWNLKQIFTVYLQQNSNGLWFVTAEGRSAGVNVMDLNKLVAVLNKGKAVSLGRIPRGVRVMSKDYIGCVLNATGLSGLGGLFTGALTKLIEKKLWQEAALYIIRVVGGAAIKGGAVGLAAFLAASAIWCATPWS